MFHRIFSCEGEFVVDVPKKNDNNQGLPNWFFNGDFLNFEVNQENDTVEWWPPMGPAPHWSEKFSQFYDNEAIFKSFDEWHRRTY